jgi:ribosomal protein L11 methylase PrmA
MIPAHNRNPASFRDPAGFVFQSDGIIYRCISNNYKKQYTHLRESGLSEKLIRSKLLLPFEEVHNEEIESNCFKIIKPLQIPFLNYAWEWSFEQLKDAALLTLQICLNALEHGMILKDATHLNIQFVNGRPQLIDTLSFEFYEEGDEWIAYRQFCECFLNPLLLAGYCRLEVHKLFRAWPEGIPASTTSSILPFKSKLNLSVLLHVHLQAKFSSGKENATHKYKKKKLSSAQIKNIIHHLKSCIEKLKYPKQKSTWSNYYSETILSQDYLFNKKEMISKWLGETDYKSAIDYGANNGEFSAICNKEAFIIAADFDSRCIDELYTHLKSKSESHILPLVLDLTQPSPSTGWNNEEQKSFWSRKKFDLGLALALVHHLAIAKNIPLEMIASLFADTSRKLIIEFVPKTDPKVIEMLSSRKDIFEDYTLDEFEEKFSKQFTIIKKEIIQGSQRTLYLMEKK